MPVYVYYTKQVPATAVALAKVTAPPASPSELVDIDTTAYAAGSLMITPFPTGTAVDAAVIGNSVSVTGSDAYFLENQFFEITDRVDADGNPQYYCHRLPSPDVERVTVTAEDGTVVSGYEIAGGVLYHDFDHRPYRVHYYYAQVLHTVLLQYRPVLERASLPGPGKYAWSAVGTLQVESAGTTYRVRFTADNGYRVLAPYTVPPNEPWYPRIRFNLRPVAREWARQPFLPARPYQLAAWVPGKVAGKQLIEFERPQMWFDPQVKQYPDILIYDRDYQLKYALDGAPVDLSRPADKGYLFPWRSSQIVDIDPLNGRVQVNVDLGDDDVIFGFYSYAEKDLIYRELDVNPFTNPAVKERIVSFFFKDQPTVDPLRSVYYEIRNADGTVHRTNDPSPGTGTRNYFGTLATGFSVALQSIQVEDVRVPGGGLAEAYRDREEARQMWDLGYWDGKPYPVGGVCVVQLPASLLAQFSRSEVVSRVAAVLPMGVLPVIRFYDESGEESLG